MSRPETWQSLPVWVCENRDCEGFWATLDHTDPSSPPLCPEHDCHERGASDHAVYAGFTWGEAAKAQNKFSCDIPVYYATPVPELVQLSTLPRELWLGLPVFHPFSQAETPEGDPVCSWHTYDVGVVVAVEPDPDWFEEHGEWRVHFQGAVGDGGWTLHYGPSNLWVPKVLAQRLS